MKIVYTNESICEANKNQYFSVDESLINHIDNKQVWLLGIINNSTKDFKIEPSYSRDSQILSNFINQYVKSGNTIISDGWKGYNFLNSESSGFHHITQVQKNSKFGKGIQSSSHIEAIWNIIKSKYFPYDSA